ncbi:MAG: DUF2142 domain-containing protein [Myxococcota bacterium]
MPSRPELAVLLYFAVAACVFAAVVPVFEAPDEPFHLGYVNFLLEHRSLPNQLDENHRVFREGHQPPLFYALAAVWTVPFRGGAPVEVDIARNPRHDLGGGRQRDVPYFLHPPDGPFPTRGDRGAFYALRGLGIALGLVTLCFTFGIARVFLPDERWVWVPGALLASLPQFVFVCSSLNSDNLANALAAAGIYLALRWFEEPKRRRHALWLGVVFGLGIATKKTMLTLLPPLALAIAWLLAKRADLRMRLIGNAGVALTTMVAIGGWVYLRNRALYGDLLGTEMEKATLAFIVHEQGLLSAYFRSTFWSATCISFVGLFGWMQIRLPGLLYVAYWCVLAAGLLAAALSLLRDGDRRSVSLLAAGFGMSSLAGLIYFNTTFPEPQGRYLFPVVSLMAVLVVFGLRSLADRVPGLWPARAVRVALPVLGVVADALSLLRIRGFY